MTNLIGQSLGRYHILEQLGEGGMAVVYKAYDTRLEREVAVKIIRKGVFPADHVERLLKRFEREAKSLARLSHPNIVKVHDYGEYEGSPYLVMEYLPSGTLKQALGKPMPWQEAVQILLPIADALGYAHKHEIIHRDVKPANILITENGQPMLADFGVAKILDSEETLELTGTGMGLGTPEYMAPEQVTSKTVDHRVDVYALGIVFYEMVTGRKPYIADTPMAVMIMHSRDPLPRPGKFTPNLPQRVENILLKALAKEPKDRYQSMADFIHALKGLESGKPKEKLVGEERSNIKLPVIPRKILIVTGASVLIIGLLAVFIKTLSAPPANLYAPPLSSDMPTNNLLGTPASTKTLPPILTPNTADTPSPTAFLTATNIPPIPTSINYGPVSTMVGKDGATLVYVPTGEFIMGSNVELDEQPIHIVNLDAFWIDQSEVTNKQYASCVTDGGCTPPSKTELRVVASDIIWYYGNPPYDENPVVYVTWNQAKDYCTWAGRELPSEAQWEKAARGTDGRTFPWGEQIGCYQASYNRCDNGPREVRVFASGTSPYGVYDMAGNVWEWVNDWYSENYYQSSPASNPLGPESGDYRVLRGGSWFNVDLEVRSSNRYTILSDSSHLAGFRCSLAAQ